MAAQAEPGQGRLALLIATAEYSDPDLRKLRAPGRDASELAEVLGAPQIGGFAVQTLINARCSEVLEAIEDFCADRHPDDQLLIYLSCHGVLDDRGRLYYASTDTRRQRTAATAVAAAWVNERLEDCRARRQIILLDCCHSGAFAGGAKGENDLALEHRFEPSGRGRLVLTASRGTEYSFEGDQASGEVVRSVFTRAIVDGLRSGDADRDKDGLISVNDLYRYVYDKVRAVEPRQTPELWTYGAEGDILFAYSIRGVVIEPVPVPEDLRTTLESPRPRVRESAVVELAGLLDSGRPGVVLGAQQALRQVCDEDIPRVAAVARVALEAPEGVAAREVSKELAKREDAERVAREDAERVAREDAERVAREDAERVAREDAERVAREDAERVAREDAERVAREDAERVAREDAERRAEKRRRTTTDSQEGHRLSPEIGRARLRKEDARLINGMTNWTDNITLPGMLQMAFLRSPYAHARIVSVDVSEAKHKSGVVAAFSGADFAAEQGSLPCAWPVTPDIVIPAHPAMAIDEVRYVGEAVAVVVARDRYAAADALEAIDVEYEPLAPVVDTRAALDKNSPVVHGQGNKCYEWVFANGDLDAAFRGAPVVLERTYRQQRLIPSAMEPRAVVCTRVGDEYTLWSATQMPHVLRMLLALVTGIPEDSVRVIAPDVGGGFGSKLQVTAEEELALLVAKRLGRPVKWTESRGEGNMAAHHGQDQWQQIRIAADRDGRIRGLAVDLLVDMGAYLMLLTPGIPLLGAFTYNSIYKMDAYSFRCTGVFTTKTPTDAYRGGGRREATNAIERIMDDLAAKLSMDPLDLRARNWIGHQEFPYTTIAGLTYDSGNYEAATEKARKLFGYDDFRREQAERNADENPIRLGIGVSIYTNMCGLAPSRVLGSLACGMGGWEYASIRMLPTGKVEVVTGSTAHGQGHETAWSQIVADQLGVPFEDIQVMHGDTQVAPKGMDTWGSRSLAVGGLALVSACDKVIAKAKVIASEMLEVPPKELKFANGVFSTRSASGATKTIQEIALAAFAAHDLPDGVEASLDSDATYDPENFSFPHGTHLCAAEVDTETGKVTIRSYVAVDDFGVVVNPLIVDGQVLGGIAQGIGQALYEEALYDNTGNLLTGTLADYLLPSAADLPSIVTSRTESRAANRLGVKGAGEAGTVAATPAVVNAILDALRPLGVEDVAMPCTPDRVWRALALASTHPGTKPRRK